MSKPPRYGAHQRPRRAAKYGVKNLRKEQHDAHREKLRKEREAAVEKVRRFVGRTNEHIRAQRKAKFDKNSHQEYTPKHWSEPRDTAEIHRRGTGGQTEGELLQTAKKKFRILSPPEIDAVLKHGKSHAWNTRTNRGLAYHTDVFEYVRDTYEDWIPGLTQELLFRVDPSIETSYKTKKSKHGLPPWLFIPAGAEARDLLEPDPRRTAWREIERERNRNRRARIAKSQPN